LSKVSLARSLAALAASCVLLSGCHDQFGPRWGPHAYPDGAVRPYSGRSVDRAGNARGSPFNHYLGNRPAATDPDSDALVQELVTENGQPRLPGRKVVGLADTSADFGTAVYYGFRDRDPLYEVIGGTKREDCFDLPVCPGEVTPFMQGEKVPLPDGGTQDTPAAYCPQPAAGADAEFDVIDENHIEYTFSHASIDCSARKIYVNDPLSPPFTGDGRTGSRLSVFGGISDGLRTSATGSRISGLAGRVRPEEFAAGRIEHALFLSANALQKLPGLERCDLIGGDAACPNVVYPAYSSDGHDENATIKMGMRLRLDPAWATDELLNEPGRFPDYVRIVLTALRDYGGFFSESCCDERPGAWRISPFISGSSYTTFRDPDPWVALSQQYGLPPYAGYDEGGTLLDRDGNPTARTVYYWKWGDPQETDPDKRWWDHLQFVKPCVTLLAQDDC
jgi:hypothetical protein